MLYHKSSTKINEIVYDIFIIMSNKYVEKKMKCQRENFLCTRQDVKINCQHIYQIHN